MKEKVEVKMTASWKCPECNSETNWDGDKVFHIDEGWWQVTCESCLAEYDININTGMIEYE